MEHMEILDRINDRDVVIGTMTRVEMRKDNLLHRGVTILVLDSKGQLYLQKRALTKDIMPGLWDISCGGGVRSGEGYDEAAKRELKEELGISVPLAFLGKFLFEDEHSRYFSTVYAAVYEGKMSFTDKEVTEGRFYSNDELKKMTKSRELCEDAKYIIENYLARARKAVL